MGKRQTSSKVEYLSRWEDLDARGCMPNIFPHPQQIFTENDPLRQITGTKYVEDFILDGQRRVLALWKDFVTGCKEGRYLPENDDVVRADAIADLDPLTSIHLSIELNSGSMEANEGELAAFFRTSPLNKVVVEITATRFGKDVVVKRVGDLMIVDEVGSSDHVATFEKARGLLELPRTTKEVRGEAKEYERGRREREWMKREESMVGPSRVSVVERQFAPTPTLSYVPAQPQTPAQLPISPPAQPIRVETQRPGTLPAAADVLAGLLKYRKEALSQLALGNEAKLTIDFSHLHPTLQYKIAKKLGSMKLERTVVVVPFDKLLMKLNDIKLLTSGYFLFYKTKQGLLECPNPRCRALIPLGPIRCQSCGQLIEDMSLLPFPYEFSFE